MSDILVRAQELGGRWVSLGSDAARGIVVEGFTADVDAWGCRSCSFILRRRTDVPWPDIGPLAPLEVFDHGLLVWSGRVKGTPTTDGSDRSITVNGEGGQYSLDDDVYQKTYAHSKLTDFVDSRSLLGCPLASWTSAGQVTSGDGVIVLTFPGDGSGSPVIPANSFVGVTLDFGLVGCTDVAVNWQNSNNAPTILFYCRGGAAPDGGVAGDDAFAYGVGTPNPVASFNTGSFASPRRYVNLFMYWAAGGTLSADVWVKVIPPTSFFSAAAYASGGYSVLKASDVVKDAKERATLLLSADESKIQTTSFAIPEFAMSGPATPREAITAANAFQNWQAGVDAYRRLFYRPLPSIPAIQVDQRALFNEASSGDASEVYTGALVTYTDAAGQQQQVARQQPSTLQTLSAIQLSNPSATTNTAGWSALTGALSRDTGVFDTTPASFKLAMTAYGVGGIGVAQLSGGGAGWGAGSWIAGRSYSLTCAVRIDSPANSLGQPAQVWIRDANGAIAGYGLLSSITANTWTPLQVQFTLQTAGAPTIQLDFYGTITTAIAWADSFVLRETAPTVVDRRGFNRTKILDTSMALTPAGAAQIGDKFLEGHKTTPLKGQLTLTGYGLASVARSGQRMRPSELLLYGGDLIRLNHLIDPDTGAIGREGRVATASWDADSDTVTVELDNQSQNFEAMLSRLALVTGQVA